MAGKVPSDYFLYPEFLAFVLFPVTWGLLPLAGFEPGLLQPWLPPNVFALILKGQWIFALTFKSMLVIHAFELVYAITRCISLGLTMFTTIKWLINVSFNGVFALKMLHDPSKFYKEKST